MTSLPVVVWTAQAISVENDQLDVTANPAWVVCNRVPESDAIRARWGMTSRPIFAWAAQAISHFAVGNGQLDVTANPAVVVPNLVGSAERRSSSW